MCFLTHLSCTITSNGNCFVVDVEKFTLIVFCIEKETSAVRLLVSVIDIFPCRSVDVNGSDNTVQEESTKKFSRSTKSSV